MPRKSIGERPMTDAERQARHRAARAVGQPAMPSKVDPIGWTGIGVT